MEVGATLGCEWTLLGRDARVQSLYSFERFERSMVKSIRVIYSIHGGGGGIPREASSQCTSNKVATV